MAGIINIAIIPMFVQEMVDRAHTCTNINVSIYM